LNSHEHHNYRILSEIDSGKPVTQRSLAGELGIALGLTNSLVKRLVKKGYLKTGDAFRSRRLKYILTPAGVAEKSRLFLVYLENTINLYTETRDKIRSSLEEITFQDKGSDDRMRVVFYGAGDVAEIAYLALDRSRFELVGVIDDHKQGQSFLSYRISSPDSFLSGENVRDFDGIVVTTFNQSRAIDNRLSDLDVPWEKVFFL
jgi:DNA-binding MarR family transcriptional regulator